MGSNWDNWTSSLKYLQRFAEERNGGDIKFGELNPNLINDFREYLHKAPTTRSYKVKLAQNSMVSYFTKLKVALKMAFKEGYIQEDINSKVEGIKPEETDRAFLSIEELNQLVKTECSIPTLKKACLFAALTGLRWSDCEKLTWGEIEHLEGDKFRIKYTQKKTKSSEYLPVSKQAVQILGEQGQPNERPFAGLKYSAYTNSHITQWIAAAGIGKKISFHNFRHTYATLQLASGTDIFTVSKLLGHKNLKTTQIYAKVVDKLKQEAAERIQLEGLGF
jgi:integrase